MTTIAVPGVRTRRVMVVDDDIDLAETLSEMLRYESYEVCVGHCTADAFRLLDEFAPEIALIDVKLGAEHGIELLRDLLEARPDLLAVVVTAYANMDTAVDSLKSGAYDFVRKPVRPEELFSVLNHCCERLELEEAKRQAVDALREANREMSIVNARLRRISESTRQLTTCEELEHFARQLLEEFAHNMAAEGGSIYLREGNRLVLASSLGETGAPAEIPLPVAQGTVISVVLETGRPVLIRDIAEEGIPVSSGGYHYNDGSALAFPLRSEDSAELAGVITLHNKRYPPFTEQDCELGLILSSFSFERLNSLRATEALAERERLYRLLADHSSDVICTVDEQMKYLYVSPSARKMWGYEPAELIGQSVGRVICATSAEAAWSAWDTLLQMLDEASGPGASVSLELEARRKDGSSVWTETRVSLTDVLPDGMRVFLGVSRDISARRRAEDEARRRQQQLMQADKLVSLGTLVAGVAHEINNPNQVIMSAGSAIQIMWSDVAAVARAYAASHPEALAGGIPLAEACTEIDEILGLMADGSERIRRIVHDLREFSRQDPGELRDDVDVNDSIQRALRLLASFVKRSTSRLTLELSDDLPKVRGNRQRLEQVFINILQNACQALTSDGQAVFVRTYGGNDGGVVIEIQDEGQGIPEESLGQIMDPFYTTKRDSGGTGLGLPVSNTIVQEHGGTIAVESQRGHGTTFRIQLPGETATPPRWEVLP